MTIRKNHSDMENLFAKARRDTPRLDENLTGAILASAQHELNRRHKPAMTISFGEKIANIFAPQRWQLASGLCAAAVLGVWLGFSGIAALPVIDRMAATIIPAATADVLDDPFTGLDDDFFGEDQNNG